MRPVGGPIGWLREPLKNGEFADRSSPPSFIVVSVVELINEELS